MRKSLRQAKLITTTTTKGEDTNKTEDGEGPAGDLPGYIPTGEDRRMREVYIDWVQFNYGKHLSGWIKDYQAWKAGWRTLGVMYARWYDAPIGRVRCRFVQVLAAELTASYQCF